MPPGNLTSQLQSIGRMIVRWKAELKFCFCSTAILSLLWIFSFSDIYLQYEKVGRIALWCLLIAMIVTMFRWMSKTMAEKYTVLGVAAAVELSFPELDNHLINFLLFSKDKTNDPFKKQYTKRGVPEWRNVKINEMKNKKLHKRATLALISAIIILALPALIAGKVWCVAVWRIVNPFSSVQPISLTHIIDVKPGNTNALQGAALLLSCDVQGKKGHNVKLEIKPDDNEKVTYAIGSISSDDIEPFSYRIPKLTTNIKYRFSAGDSPSPQWYEIKTRVPLAFTHIDIDVKPPEYTGLKDQKLDGLADELSIPQGSTVDVSMECNNDIQSATITTKDNEPVEFKKGKNRKLIATVTISSGNTMQIKADDVYSEHKESEISYTLIEDKPPIVQIINPKGQTILPPGTSPNIEFNVIDDYGIVDVEVERVQGGTTKNAKGEPIDTWTVGQIRGFSKMWQGGNQKSRTQEAMVYRVVAKDNCPFRKQESKSASVVFNGIKAAAVAEKRDKEYKLITANLSKVIQLQKNNISKTGKYKSVADQITPNLWKELADVQVQIRGLTKELIVNPLNPLGGIADSIKKVYMNEMHEVISEIQRIPKEEGTAKTTLITKSLSLEEKILRYLTYADNSVKQVKTAQATSAIQNLIIALIKGEKTVIKTTTLFSKNATPISSTLVDKQDSLASDLIEFMKACEAEAGAVEANDTSLAATLRSLATGCKEQKISDDMMLTSDNLDKNQPTPALTHANSALTKLTALKAKLDKIQALAETDKLEEMEDVLEHSKETIKKIHDLQAKALESMDMVKEQKSLNNKETDLMEEEYSELTKLNKASMLEVPTDLNIFMDLNVANDQVEDVFDVFEEVEQAEKTKKELTEGSSISTLAPVRAEGLLETMEEAQGSMDKMEEWLGDKPETKAITPEEFDKEELPPEGMALAALTTEADSLISDLLEQEEEEAQKAQDSATNTAIPDTEPGGPVEEGETSSFGAKGEPGNEEPDHREGDGRSNVGRQGMSNGENSSGSGTIQEGDPNIEERRTQDPTQSGQVDLDGEADTKATGGGKLGTGKADDFGDVGGTERMSSTEKGSWEGMEAALAKKANSMYAKASMKNVRAGSLMKAAHYMEQAADAVAKGQSIETIKELRRKAIVALQTAKTELSAGTSESIDNGRGSPMLDNVVEDRTDQAPTEYRDLVAEYYKSLNSNSDL